MTRGSPTITVPFTVVRDQRENAPYQFLGLTADAKQKNKPLIVPVKSVHLVTGDYSIEGYEDVICIERKSKEDLYATLRDGEHRDRFKREHERMTSYAFACVVIESSWEDLIENPPANCQLNPKTVWRTFQKWRLRYGVNWEAIGPRAMAEEHTFRTLQFYLEEFANGNNA